MDAGITEAERDFIRHALGLNRGKVGYRNFYAAGGGDAVAIGRALVAKGLAVEVATGHHRPDVNFMITADGFGAAKKRGDKMDREETQRMHAITHREACRKALDAEYGPSY